MAIALNYDPSFVEPAPKQTVDRSVVDKAGMPPLAPSMPSTMPLEYYPNYYPAVVQQGGVDSCVACSRGIANKTDKTHVKELCHKRSFLVHYLKAFRTMDFGYF